MDFNILYYKPLYFTILDESKLKNKVEKKNHNQNIQIFKQIHWSGN